MERLHLGGLSRFCSIAGFCGAILYAQNTWAQTGTWIQIQDIPTSRAYAPASAASGKVFVFGGGNWNSFSGQNEFITYDRVEEFDPETGTWMRKQNMPTAACGASAVEIDGMIYVIGGQNPFRGASLASTYVFDPLTDSWTKLADMPTARGYLTTVLFNHKIYAMGGVNGDRALSTVEIYDPGADTWTRAKDMPTARGMFTADVVDGKINTMGGIIDNSGLGLSTVEIFDPASDSWSKEPDLPRARWGHGSVLVDGLLYLFGGGSAPVLAYSEVDVYETASGTWTRASSMPRPRRSFASAVMTGRVYVLGGIAGGAGAPAVNSSDVFDVGVATSAGPQATSPRSAHHSAFPNPFGRTTTINFPLTRPSFVSLQIFDVLGRQVFSLLESNMPAGTHSVAWDASRNAPGVYVYRLADSDGIREGTLVSTR